MLSLYFQLWSAWHKAAWSALWLFLVPNVVVWWRLASWWAHWPTLSSVPRPHFGAFQPQEASLHTDCLLQRVELFFLCYIKKSWFCTGVAASRPASCWELSFVISVLINSIYVEWHQRNVRLDAIRFQGFCKSDLFFLFKYIYIYTNDTNRIGDSKVSATKSWVLLICSKAACIRPFSTDLFVRLQTCKLLLFMYKYLPSRIF